MQLKLTSILLLFVCLNLTAQHVQFKFCGKTTIVSPTNDGSGKDQRYKGQIRLDVIKLGTQLNAFCCPFYAIGEPSLKPPTYANVAFVDNCTNNANMTACTGCTTCKDPYYGNNIVVGTFEGQMFDNVRLEGKNNDLLIQSTGTNNQVCFTTSRIDISPYKGKVIEVYIKYEGSAIESFSTKNISFSYRYNTDAWPSTPYFFNKNSNNIGIFEQSYQLKSVPLTGTSDLSELSDVSLSPNPADDFVDVEYTAEQDFEGSISLLTNYGAEIYTQKQNFEAGVATIHLNTSELPTGFYFIRLENKAGEQKTLKFTK